MSAPTAGVAGASPSRAAKMKAQTDATALRDRLGAQLRFEQRGRVGTWWGGCPSCGAAKASLGRDGFVCTTCGKNRTLRDLELFPDLSTEAVPKAEATRFHFVSVAELERRPKPEPLIDQLLPLGGLAALYGPPGDGKSLAALHWSLCTGIGLACWHVAVRRGSVIYVSAEGASGLGPRVTAWRDYHRVTADPSVHFVLDAVQLMSEAEVWRFVREVRETFTETPVLIVFDTLARCLIGGDENSARDMGLAIRGADIVRRELRCTVLLIHHANKSGDSERGSTALRGAVDVLLSLKKEEGGTLTLRCEKSKESEPFADLELRLEPHLGSVVITPAPGVVVTGFNLTSGEVATLRALSETALPEGLSVSNWQEASRAKGGSFFRHRKALWLGHFIERTGEGVGAKYRVSPKGLQALTPTLPQNSHGPGSDPKHALPPTEPLFREARNGSGSDESQYLEAERIGLQEDA